MASHRSSSGLSSPSQASQKKQQSISSFFTAAPSKAPNASLSRYSSSRASPSHGEDTTSSPLSAVDSHGRAIPHGLKHGITGADQQDGVDVKRRKINHDDSNDLFVAPDLGDSVTSQAHDQSSNNVLPKHVVVSDRTSRYLFSSSPAMAESRNPTPPQGEDEAIQRERARLHESFVKKLGGADSLINLKKRTDSVLDDAHDQDEAGSEDDEAEKPPPKSQKGRKAAASRKDKYTPLERQVIDIKRQNPDTLLIVEVGYKFRFFGEDARTASKELNIFCIPGKYRFDEHPSETHLDRFASASVPVHRLHVHVRRLVSAGHKVGVVRQLETAALKAAGSNRNSAFERGLTNLYTKGTYIDDAEGLQLAPSSETDSISDAGHLLCLTETFPKGWGTDEKVQIGFVAVQPATGDVVYDDFEDGWMRSELETRLLHIAPCEFLIVGEVTNATQKLIQHLINSRSNVFGDRARIETVDKPKTMAAQAHSHLTKFYADKMKAAADDTPGAPVSTGALLDKVHKLSENATICLSAMIKHLSSYKLEHVFDLTKYFQSFSARSHMLINGNTLNSLEIFCNQTDLTTYGSLFWAMDRTQTRFGQRLLRKWVARPLLDREKLTQRLSAVTELRNNWHSSTVSRLQALLGRIKSDLERSLIRIYYKKCTRPEILAALQTLHSIAQEYAHVSSAADSGFTSHLISDGIASLPRIGAETIEYLDRINAEAGKADDKYNFFRDEHETDDITNHKVGIVAVEQDLEEFRAVAADKLKRKRVDYVTVAGIDYLIELDNSMLKNVPASWIKVSGTKKASRYHAPEVMALIRERDQHKEALANACDEAYSNMLAEIGSKYQTFRDCVQSLAQLDCLLSLAEIASQPGYTLPIFKDKPGIVIKAGRHPMVEQVLLTAFVPNDIELETDATRALLVTGPNMGGKSSYVRSVALIAIMAQCGSYVPADSACLGLLDAVFTRMGAFDNMMKRESTFMVELSETSDILKQATPRSLVILDELGRGTSTHDGVAIAEAVLHHMVTQLQSFTLFITHYQTLSRIAQRYDGELRNVHMRFAEGITDDEGHDITFLYEVGEGIAHRSYGLNVARLAGLPKSLISHAASRSRDMEKQEKRQRIGHLAQAMHRFASAGDRSILEHLTTGIEQL